MNNATTLEDRVKAVREQVMELPPQDRTACKPGDVVYSDVYATRGQLFVVIAVSHGGKRVQVLPVSTESMPSVLSKAYVDSGYYAGNTYRGYRKIKPKLLTEALAVSIEWKNAHDAQEVSE